MKRNLCHLVLVVSFSGLVAAQFANGALAAEGAVYYVDSEGGDDAGDGLSKKTAWKSLEAVNSHTFAPGDTVFFKAGCVWKGQLKPQGSGTAANPIRIDQYGKEGSTDRYEGLPRIDGGGEFDAAVLLYNVEGWEVRGLEVTNTGPEDKPKRTGVWVEINDFGTARHIVLDGLFIHDVNGSKKKSEGAGQAIFLYNHGDKRKSRFDGLTIQNCYMLRCHRNGIIQDGYWERDTWHPNLNLVFRGNLLEQIPGDGIVPIGCDGAVVEYNVMRDCPATLPNGEWAAGLWPWSCDNTVIQFNEVCDHKAPGDGQGFDCDWNCRNTVIQYNFSHDNDGGFMLICNAPYRKMPQNIGTIGSVVRYNLSVNDGIRGEERSGGDFAPIFHVQGPCKDTQVYNNTIIVPKRAKPDMDRTLIRMNHWDAQEWPEDTVFRNNVFYAEDEVTYTFGGDQGTVFLSNLYYGKHINRPFDERAIDADPGFVDLALKVTGERPRFVPKGGFAHDGFVLRFRPRPGSPLIGAGVLVPDRGEHDLVGNPLGEGGGTVGAIE